MSENLRMRYLEEQYETLTTLGEPDAGRVFLVKDKRNGKIAVKKYVSAEAAGLYERLRGIKNRYMARVYETATDGQRGIVIEEYINGTTLGDYLEERNVLQPEEVYHIMTQLSQTVTINRPPYRNWRNAHPGIQNLMRFRPPPCSGKKRTSFIGTVIPCPVAFR